jgi:hypothetical protein
VKRRFGALGVDTAWRGSLGSSTSSSSPEELEPALDEPAETWPEGGPDSLADSHMTIPGMSDSGDGCGEWAPRDFCDTCGEVHFGEHRCQQRGCPDCWSTWATQRAEKVVYRLQARRYTLPDGIERRVTHNVVSPPEGAVSTLNDVVRYRRKAHEKAKEAGIRGGVCVFHGFRVKEEVKREYRRRSGEDEAVTAAGMWRFVRENDRMWRQQVYWSPHFHYIGLATEVEPVEEEGWIVERLSTAAPMTGLRDRDSYESLAKIATYVMSHATFEPPDPDSGAPGKKAVTWFGDVHPSNFAIEDADPPESPGPAVSKGAQLAIERLAGEATGAIDPDRDGPVGEPEDCPDEACTGYLRSIYDYLDYQQEMDVDRDTERALATAFEWALGEVIPPPGLRSPRTEEDCEEAFEYLLESDR